MNDEHALFLTALGDACVCARLGGFALRVTFADGHCLSGAPEAFSLEDVGIDSGYGAQLLIDSTPVPVDTVVAFEVSLGAG